MPGARVLLLWPSWCTGRSLEAESWCPTMPLSRLRFRTMPPPDAKAKIALELNGEPVEVAFAPHKTLLEVLREDAGLTGTKHGCELGNAGPATGSSAATRASPGLCPASTAPGRGSRPSGGWPPAARPHP